jgi:hypothetical protein
LQIRFPAEAVGGLAEIQRGAPALVAQVGVDNREPLVVGDEGERADPGATSSALGDATGPKPSQRSRA